MIVRTMMTADLDQVMIIENASYIHPWLRENYIAELSNREFSYNFVACHGAEIIAYVSFHLLFETASINKFTVAASYRRQGVGQKLIEDIINRLAIAEAERIVLEVRVSNEIAQKLYYKNMFKQISIRSGYYSNGEDALVLERKLV